MQLPYPDISAPAVCTPDVLKTLQCWLSVLQPAGYTQPVDGIYNRQITTALDTYKAAGSDQTWTTLEKAMNSLAPASLTAFSFETFPSVSARFARIGIRYEASEEERAKEFCSAFLHRQHLFSRRMNENSETPLMPFTLGGNTNFTSRTWNKFQNTWGLFYGAPWLGIVTDPMPGMLPGDSFWCSSELFSLLREWGQNYLSYLSATGKQMPELTAYPIRVVYTGCRLGGSSPVFPGHSQIGLSAVLAGFDETSIPLNTISETLAATDPAWRIRVRGEGNSPFDNISFSKSITNPVLEMHPEWERLLHHTGAFLHLLKKMEITGSEKRHDRFVEGLKNRIEWISADELILIFDSVRKTAPENFFSFIGKLMSAGIFTTILRRIYEEEEVAVDFIGKLFGITELGVIAPEWQEKVASLFMYQDQFEKAVDVFQSGSFDKVLQGQLKNIIA